MASTKLLRRRDPAPKAPDHSPLPSLHRQSRGAVRRVLKNLRRGRMLWKFEWGVKALPEADELMHWGGKICLPQRPEDASQAAAPGWSPASEASMDYSITITHPAPLMHWGGKIRLPQRPEDASQAAPLPLSNGSSTAQTALQASAATPNPPIRAIREIRGQSLLDPAPTPTPPHHATTHPVVHARKLAGLQDSPPPNPLCVSASPRLCVKKEAPHA